MKFYLNKPSVRPTRLIFTLCVLCASVVNIFAQEWKAVADGVEYARVAREFSGKPVNINLLRLDLKKVRLDVHHAMDMAIGTEKTSSIATRHSAFAAINAGFFRLDNSIWAGDAAGVLMIDHKLLSESTNNRVALAIANEKDKTEAKFGHLHSISVVGFGVDTEFWFAGVNRERKIDEIILYTPDFNRTTLTDDSGTELILRDCANNGMQKRCFKAEISNGKGNSVIPTGGYVISIGKNALEKSNNILYHVKERVDLRVVIGIGPLPAPKNSFFPEAEDIVAGVPQLIKNGKIDITWEQEKASKSFVETRHPRTAVAKLKDGKFLMITVDGRTEQSAGLDLYDLAKYMLELGAMDAMNLDGGGSTTMFLDGKVVNRPSDKEGERKVGDAILVTLRKKRN
ncbi:MAG: phosphodiester glycosidase family protein [Pyrinomonadaceae bacterium]